MIKKLKRALGTCFGRRRIVVLDDHCWSGVRWDRILSACWELRLLFEFRPVSLEDMLGCITQEDDALVDGVLSELVPGNCGTLCFHGLNLWELSKSGICASLEAPTLAGDIEGDREIGIARHYFRFVCRLVIASERMIDHEKPDCIVVSQGASPMTRPLVEVARSCGISVAATENSFAGRYFFCDNATGMILNRHRSALLSGAWLDARQFDSQAMEDFDSFLAKEKSHKRKEHASGEGHTASSALSELGIPSAQRVAVFIGQVYTDASIIMDSRFFTDPAQLISMVWEFFKERPEWTLVVRLHPKEWKGNSWANGGKLPGPPPGEPEGCIPYNSLTARKLAEIGLDNNTDSRLHIIADQSVDTQAVMSEAELGITVNSQAGFEMALMDKPVVVCGDAFYGRKGFTLDVGHPDCLEPILRAASEGSALPADSAMKVRRFGSLLFREVLFPRTIDHEWRRLLSVVSPSDNHGVRNLLLNSACRKLDGASAPDRWYAPN